jgi:ferredoxin-NADP reductase
LYSVREPDAVWYGAELQSLQALPSEDSSVSVTHAYTRVAPEGWLRPPGRIDAALIASMTWPSRLRPTCYVCGPTSFVERAAGLLAAAGNSPERIRTERFGPTGGRR